jgi:putative nucleotidyltransferase with HDIG domain
MAAYFRGLMRLTDKKTNPWLEGAGVHLLQTAQIAEKLSRSAGGLASPATVFTTGMLHDVGKLVFSKIDTIYALEIKDLVFGGTMAPIEAEQQILGMDHAEAGAHLAERWKIPEVIREAIHHHHTPLSTDSLLTGYVYIANELFHLIQQDIDLEAFLKRPGIFQVMETVRLSEDHVREAVDAFQS